MGDFNAVVGEGSEEKSVRKYGLGKRNQRGERLVNFCKKNEYVITNTFSKTTIEDNIRGKSQETLDDIKLITYL